MKYILLKIFILVILLYIIFTFFDTIENFEDKFDDFEKYEEIYDSEFVNLYEIIYRDYSDIDYDTNIFYEKCFFDGKFKNDDISIMIGGSGVGKLCKKIK